MRFHVSIPNSTLVSDSTRIPMHHPSRSKSLRKRAIYLLKVVLECAMTTHVYLCEYQRIFWANIKFQASVKSSAEEPSLPKGVML
jgi:hypothetical protein